MTRATALLLCVVGLPSVTLAAKSYVVTPEVEWQELLPYIRANIVAQLEDREFHVFVCQGQTDRSVVTPFDEGLSDFAKVLVTQALRDNRKVGGGIETVTTRFRDRVSALAAHDRERYRELFWDTLSESGQVLPEIQSLFESARSTGVLRCWLCDRDAGFAPHATRTEDAKSRR